MAFVTWTAMNETWGIWKVLPSGPRWSMPSLGPAPGWTRRSPAGRVPGSTRSGSGRKCLATPGGGSAVGLPEARSYESPGVTTITSGQRSDEAVWSVSAPRRVHTPVARTEPNFRSPVTPTGGKTKNTNLKEKRWRHGNAKSYLDIKRRWWWWRYRRQICLMLGSDKTPPPGCFFHHGGTDDAAMANRDTHVKVSVLWINTFHFAI